MRDEIVTQWLSQSQWSKWSRHPMTGDASARQYERLENRSGISVILMNAPPETCGSQSRFVEVATHLSNLNLAAPQILDWDETLGLMVLEDLGQTDFAAHLKTSPDDERVLYERAVDAMLVLQSAPPPQGLVSMTSDVGAQMIDIAFEWTATDQSPDLQLEIKTLVRDLLAQVGPTPCVLSLRDFHAENLVWRPEKSGLAQVGLLDFQDAFITHPTYDLASLLRDARRDVHPNLLDPLLAKLATNSAEIKTLKTAFHVMALQRNLRILGIFQRLAHQNGKDSYLQLIPRVWGHIQTDLAAPVCADIAPLINRAFAQSEAAT